MAVSMVERLADSKAGYSVASRAVYWAASMVVQRVAWWVVEMAVMMAE